MSDPSGPSGPPDPPDPSDPSDQSDPSARSDPSAPSDPDSDLPVDPDNPDDADPPTLALVLVIAAGGVLGALARWGLAVHLPTVGGGFPWATLSTNVTGSLLLGLLMARLAAHPQPSAYLRPFLGVGVLGGYTTFSTYATDGRALLAGGHPGSVAAYLLGTVALCMLASFAGLRLGRLGRA